MSPDPLVPLSSLRSLLGLVVMAATFVMGLAAIPWILRIDAAPWFAAALATAGMCRLTVRVATRNPEASGGGLERTLGWALLFGIANAPVAFLAASMVQEPGLQMFPMAMMATIIGAPFGLFFGLLFGVVLSMPVGAYVRAWQRPSPDTTDATLAVLGVWLAIAVGLAVLFIPPKMQPDMHLWRVAGDLAEPGVVRALAVLLGLCGVGLASVAWLRMLARRRFISRVALRLEPDWRVGEAPPDRSELEHLPCLGETEYECDHLLLRCEQPGDGAYRSAATEWPVAWVPRTWLDCIVVNSPPA